MRRVVVILAFLFGFIGLAVPASATATSVSVRATSGEVTPSVAYTVSGHVSPSAARSVVLQHLVGAAWKNVATGMSGKTGNYALRVTPTVAGTWRLRVRVMASTTVLATSAIVTLQVRVRSSVVAGFAYATSVQNFAAPLNGTVTPQEAGRSVSLQQLTAGTWVAVASTVTDRAGKFAFDAPTTTAGNLQFRVSVAASATRGAAVGAPMTLPVAIALVGHGAILIDNGGHVSAHELAGTGRDLGLPVSDQNSGAIAYDGRIVELSADGYTMTLTGPSLAPVVLAHVTATTCIASYLLSSNGHAVVWATGTLSGSTCQATAVFVRNIDKGVTTRLAVDATALAGSTRVGYDFDHTGAYVQVVTEPAVKLVPTYSFNALFTDAGVPVSVSGSADLGELLVTEVAAPSGQLVAFDLARGMFVVATVGSGARPTPFTDVLLYDLVGNPSGTKIAYVVDGADGHHLFAANVDFSAPVDLGPIATWTQATPVSILWVGDTAVGVNVDTTSADGLSSTSVATIKSAADGAVLYTGPQHLFGWLS